MAVLSSDQLTDMRKKMAVGETVVWTKPQLNAALQAIEDWYETNKVAIGTAIDVATAPLVFTAAQKKKLGAYWLLQKASREGA